MRLVLPFLALVASGCAVRSGYVLVNAQRAVQKAGAAGAERLAPYEYTLATAYLIKAQEENLGNDYQHSEKLAKSSMEWAQRAVEASADAERNFGEDFVPEERKEKPVEPEKEDSGDQINLDEI
jgi:hypothetical protein